MKIFIMGMHRSGTSLVTGLLSMCGLYLGNNLLMTARDNPKGHFEDRDFIKINNELLRFNHGSWKNPPGRVIPYKELAVKAKKFLNSFPKDKIVGFKDPRICLTFSFWLKMISPEPIEVVFVHRPVSEIASSLKERNNMPLGMGLKLAKIYIYKGETTLDWANIKPHEIHFHDFFKPGWKVNLCYLCSVLGLKYPKNPARLEKFVDENLWHHREGKSDG